MKTITIMPDYGNSPYAWLKEAADNTRYVGMSVGGYLCIPSEFPISSELHDSFVAWCGEFEVNAEKPSFDWTAFHLKGISLARQLKAQVGSAFRVIYSKPMEDPEHDSSELTELV